MLNILKKIDNNGIKLRIKDIYTKFCLYRCSNW